MDYQKAEPIRKAQPLTDAAPPAATQARPRDLPASETHVLAPRRSRYCLVIPVINEGDRISGQLERIRKLQAGIDVVVADGGSTDGSVAPERLAAAGVRALLTKRGPGRLSAQLRMAYAWALDEGYDGIVTIDGNGKDGVEAIAAFTEKLDEGFGYVQGSRYLPGGRAVNTPLFRWVSGRFIHAPLVSLAARHWFTDTTNGFRAYSRAFLMDDRLQPFRSEFSDYSLLFYLSAKASRLGYKVTEIPVTRVYPATGKVPTKITGFGGKVRLLGELLRVVGGGFDPR